MHEEDTGCLLSGNTAQELGVVQFNLNKIADSQGPTANTKDQDIQAIIEEYKEVFTGLGKLKNHAVKLNIDKEAIPQAQPQRRIPFHIRKKVKHAVKELQREDIIEAVPETQPTPWVSPRLMTMSPLYPCGKPCSRGTHHETVKNLALLSSIINGIRKESRLRISIPWECVQFLNRIENSITFTR